MVKPTRAQLILLYCNNGLSAKALADQLRISRNKVYRLLAEYGIPRRSPRDAKLVDGPSTASVIKSYVQHYLGQGLTVAECGQLIGLSAPALLARWQQLGFETRNHAEAMANKLKQQTPRLLQLQAQILDEEITLNEAANSLEITPGQFQNKLKAIGSPMPKAKGATLTPEDEQQLVALYQQHSLAEVSRRLEISTKKAREVLTRHNVSIRPHQQALRQAMAQTSGKHLRVESGNPQRLGNELNPATAWALGVIWGDGTLCRSTGVCHVYSKDRGMLEQIADAFELDHRAIYDLQRCHSNRAQSHTLTIANPAILRHLVDYGLTPNKSATISTPPIAADLRHHFYRGYFDADGGFSLHGPKRRLRASISSKSVVMMIEFSKWLRSIGITPIRRQASLRRITDQPEECLSIMKTKSGVFALAIQAESHVTLFAQALYLGSHVKTRLERKYRMIQHLL
ncbi:hypothetical protein SAMN02745129_2435 [Ferrimonas marina]|uniref:DOD-type homing endonuclease domain-containing protein n=2 Tax=Ferrimonas marina TaxID=299255 RepID=A0A1M5U7G6_9GAMM|nr:hypothetical protein SAMN02745129_2435 [Ferrimonas marina]